MADCQISAISDQVGPSTSKDLSAIPEGRVGQGMHFLSFFSFTFFIESCCEFAFFLQITPVLHRYLCSADKTI